MIFYYFLSNVCDRTWTCNLRIKSPLLCQLSHTDAYSASDEIRTHGIRVKSPLPYHLATDAYYLGFSNCFRFCFRFMIFFSFVLISYRWWDSNSHFTGFEPVPSASWSTPAYTRWEIRTLKTSSLSAVCMPKFHQAGVHPEGFEPSKPGLLSQYVCQFHHGCIFEAVWLQYPITDSNRYLQELKSCASAKLG